MPIELISQAIEQKNKWEWNCLNNVPQFDVIKWDLISIKLHSFIFFFLLIVNLLLLLLIKYSLYWQFYRNYDWLLIYIWRNETSAQFTIENHLQWNVPNKIMEQQQENRLCFTHIYFSIYQLKLIERTRKMLTWSQLIGRCVITLEY